MSVTTQQNLVEKNVADVYRAVLDGVSADVLAVGLHAEAVEQLLAVLAERTDGPAVRLLTTDSVLKTLTSDFTLASTAADLVAAGTLSLRTTDRRLDGPLVLTDDAAVAVVMTERQTAGLTTDDDAFVAAAREEYAARWDEAETFGLRTPPLSRVTETLEEEFGPQMVADFDRMRTALGTQRGDGALDEVDICLLAAAKNEALLYDISTWGEDVGVASRATFSRKKTALEERGLIDTEKVPVEVGRPRLRLLLGDERLQEADASDLVSVAGGMLSTAA